MPHRGHFRAECRICEREREPGERFSARGKCPDCGIGHMRANAEQLHAHEGEWLEHWRRRVAASVGAILLDDS